MQTQEVIPGVLTARQIIQDHMREMGARGGSAKTPAKVASSRRNIESAIANRKFKCATRRMQTARADVSARPRRITVQQYEGELSRFTKAYDEYQAFLKRRERGYE